MNLKEKINNILKRFNVELHGSGYLQSLAKGDFKKDEYDFFRKVFKDEKLVIYDIGANRGTTVLKFSSIFPKSRIFAFEPIASLYDIMCNNFGKNEKIKIQNIGIADVKGEFTFYVNKSLDTSSFLPSQKTGLNSDAQVENSHQMVVPVITIEQSFLSEKIDRINILKLDIQGGELKALRGAESLLKDGRIDVVYTEAYFVQQYVNQPLFAEISLFLSDYNYQLQDIYNPIYGKGKLAWCDAVFVRSDFNLV
jgi:FkbM family methyltransferase